MPPQSSVQALAGKHVVTSNKQLVAEHGTELLALAKAHGVSFLFEASVGGGIPVLHPLSQCLGANIDTVSIGATPSVMNGSSFEGITELRLGTYIFFDVGQSNAIHDFSHCAATVLASVISKPEGNRVVLDTGAKALVSQNRPTGICATAGFGAIKGAEDITIGNLFDEHGVLNSEKFKNLVNVGDKVEVIPSHVCPTVNLYDTAYLVSNGKVIQTLPIACRGKSR